MTTQFQFDTQTDFTSLPANTDPDLSQLRTEIESPASTIAVQIASGPTLVGTTVTIEFKADLSAQEEIDLAAIVAAHVPSGSSASSSAFNVSLVPIEGALPTVVDGLMVSVGPDAWGIGELPLSQNLHIGGNFIAWRGAKLGDRGFAALIYPAGDVNPTGPSAQGAQAIEVPAQVIPLYAAGAAVEIWDSDQYNNLLQIAPIASAAGTTVTLGTTLVQAIDATNALRLCMGMFTQVRGAAGLDGGAYLLGDGELSIDNVGEITAAVHAACVIAARVRTTPAPGTRELAINFKFRVPASGA